MGADQPALCFELRPATLAPREPAPPEGRGVRKTWLKCKTRSLNFDRSPPHQAGHTPDGAGDGGEWRD